MSRLNHYLRTWVLYIHEYISDINSSPPFGSIEKSDIKEKKNTTTFLSPNFKHFFELKKKPLLQWMSLIHVSIIIVLHFHRDIGFITRVLEIIIFFVSFSQSIISWNLVCIAAGCDHLLSALLNYKLFEGRVIVLSLFPRLLHRDLAVVDSE